jgi:uncharacterized protein (DUF58 family)
MSEVSWSVFMKLGRTTLARQAHTVLERVRSATAHESSDDPDVLLDGPFLRQLETLRFNAPRAATAGLAGEHASRRKAHSVEFADHRNYAPGDDFRLIDWNVYARLGELCLKLTEARENLAVHVLLDCSASMDWGRPNKLLYAKRVAAALGTLALASYDTVHLGAFSDDVLAVFPPLRGRGAVSALLGHLRGLEPGATTDLARAVASYCGRPGRTGVALLLTDFLVSSGHAEALGYLARSGLHTTALHIVDAQEERPPLDGLLELRDRETGELVKVGITPDLLRRYDAHFRAWSGEIESACRARRAHYVRVPTAVAPRTLVLYTLRREGVLQ